MPTQIIDNFDLNTSKPLDNRLVVGPNSFYTSKDLITYKYEGMRVWDLNDGIPYVWTGATFSSENNVSVTGNGIENYLAKFGAASNVIGSSQIFDNGTSIGIAESSPNSSYRLHVNGKIYASSGFIGDGSLITGLNATNINSGVMGIQYLQGGNSGWILTSNNASSVSYKDPSTISVGSSNQLTTTRTLWGQNFNGSQNVSGNISVGGSITNITGSVQFKNVNNGILSFYWTGTTNINQNLKIPSYVSITSAPRTLALLEQSQIFTGVNTFTDFQNFEDNIQVGGTSSFNNEIRVYVTKNLGGFLGNVTQNPLNVQWAGICIGATSSKSSPYITVGGEYTWYGDDTSMYRITTHSGVTYSGIAFKTDGYTQMVLNNLTGTYSTGAEHYSTPGIAMMSVLDVWNITGFDSAVYGVFIPRFVWLNTTVNSIATSLPYTTDAAGTVGPGAAQAQAGNAATNYDRMVVISTSGRTQAFVYLETSPGSGSYWMLNNIFKDSSFSLIIPAGRKYKVMMTRASTDQVTDETSSWTVANAQTNDDTVRFVSYKWGMN